MAEIDPRKEFDRQGWMSLLAKAPAARLRALFETLGTTPEVAMLRAPETGSVMVRGRTGAIGAPFNLGEMTVSRCSLSLPDGRVGHSFVAGRDKRHAELAAICDALLQGPEAAEVLRIVLRPLAEEAASRAKITAAKAAATKVEFFTMQRGES